MTAFSVLYILSLILISTLWGRDNLHFTNEDETQKGNQLSQGHKSRHIQLDLNPDMSATGVSVLSFVCVCVCFWYFRLGLDALAPFHIACYVCVICAN